MTGDDCNTMLIFKQPNEKRSKNISTLMTLLLANILYNNQYPLSICWKSIKIHLSVNSLTKSSIFQTLVMGQRKWEICKIYDYRSLEVGKQRCIRVLAHSAQKFNFSLRSNFRFNPFSLK